VSLLLLPQGILLLRLYLHSLQGENEEESVCSDPKTLTALRMIVDKLSSKRLPSLKLSAAFPVYIPGEKASTMSWND